MNNRIAICLLTVMALFLTPRTLLARYLNLETGRFMTMDTFQGDNQDPSSLHKYLYTKDNPINEGDPSGHGDWDTFFNDQFSVRFAMSWNPQGALAVDQSGTCGPDVTLTVRNTEYDVENKYIHAPMAIKRKVADHVPWGMGDGWDIGPLKLLGWTPPAADSSDFGGCPLGTGAGAKTVQYGSGSSLRVYNASAVNYILWGKMYSLLNNSFPFPVSGNFSLLNAEECACDYKTYYWGDTGITRTEAYAFVMLGYSGTLPISTALPIPTKPSNICPLQRFKWKFRGLQEDEE